MLTSLRRVVAFAVMVLVLEYAAVHLLVPARSSWRSIGTADLRVLACALVLELMSFGCFSGLTHTLLGGRRAAPYGVVLGVDLTGNGVSHVVPGGGATAAALRFRLLERIGIPGNDAISAATLEAAVNALWLVVAFVAGLILAAPFGGTPPFMRTACVIAAVLLVAFGGLLTVLAVRPDQVVTVTHVMARRLRPLRQETLESLVRVLIGQVAVLHQDRRAGRRALSWGLGYWGLDALCLYLCLRAFGFWPNPGGVLTTYALVCLIALLPLTPGGLGLVETVAVPVLVSFGTPREVALLGVLSWRLLEFWLPIPIALVTYLSLRLTVLRGEPG